MEETATQWIDKNYQTIAKFMDGLLTYKFRREVSKVTGVPILNILIFPRSRTEYRFTLANLVTEEGTPIYVTPSQAQELSYLITEKLGSMYPGGEFSIKRNHEYSVYLKYSDKGEEVSV